MKKSIFATFLLFSLFFTFAVPKSAGAQALGPACDMPDKTILGIPAWYKYLKGNVDVNGECTIGLSNGDDDGTGTSTRRSAGIVLPIGLAVLEILMTLAGLVAVVMIFWGSFQYVLTQGEPDKASSARKTVTNALIGLVIVLVATRFIGFIGGRLG